jgi:hypothetical protein
MTSGIARYWFKEIERVKRKICEARDMVLLQKQTTWTGSIEKTLTEALDILNKGRAENEIHKVGDTRTGVEDRRTGTDRRSKEGCDRTIHCGDNGKSTVTSFVSRGVKEAK